MAVPNPIDWDRVQRLIGHFVSQVAEIPPARVQIQTPRDKGPARGPAPKAMISLVSLVPTQTQGRKIQPRIMQQRYTVTATGPGEVGVDFYDGHSLTPQRISIIAGVGDPPATSAAALLLELQADLPAGYTASDDPADTVSVLVDGSAAEPLFNAAPADASFLTVTTPMPRFPYVLRVAHSIVWRVVVRTSEVAGPLFAANAISKLVTYRRSQLDKYLYPLSFEPAGTAQETPFIPVDRSESLGTLDMRWTAIMTGAEAATAMRVAGLTLTSAAAA